MAFRMICLKNENDMFVTVWFAILTISAGHIMATKTDAVPQKVLPNVKEAVEAFVGDAPQFDDLTMLALKQL